METGYKHLIKCNCILHQFKNHKDPPQHCFIVFSIFDDDVIRKSYEKCNNCGIVHHIVDVCKSNILTGKEEIKSILDIDELKTAIPARIADILEKNSVDYATWKQVQWIVDTQQWGLFVCLSKEKIEHKIVGKNLIILGRDLFKFESFENESILEG